MMAPACIHPVVLGFAAFFLASACNAQLPVAHQSRTQAHGNATSECRRSSGQQTTFHPNAADRGSIFLQLHGKRFTNYSEVHDTADFEPVNGGQNQACRGINADDNSRSYYSVMTGVASLHDCKGICLGTVKCSGVEYDGRGRCEIWIRAGGIKASKAVQGYTCLRLSVPVAAPSIPDGFEAVDGGENRACRGSSWSDNSQEYYIVRQGLMALAACANLCSDMADCKGIEHNAGTGRCELWTRPDGVESSVSVAGFTCLRRSQTSQMTCAEYSSWPNIDRGVTCSGCTALVVTEPYGGRCDRYCRSFGHVCKAAAEEVEENCEVKYTAKCDEPISGTSDMLCTCLRDTGDPPSGTTATPTTTTTATTTVTTGATPSTDPNCCAPFSDWPQVDNGVTCSSCTALVLTSPFAGRCDRYCASFGHICVEAAEEVNENCEVKYTASCSTEIALTSDMLCTCRKPQGTGQCSASPPTTTSAPAPVTTTTTTARTVIPPGSSACCSAFNLWPNVDGGVTCDNCRALVLTAPYGGRCDRYCESFGHVCVAAAEEEAEDCSVKFQTECDVAITGTSDMLCTCKSPTAADSCFNHPTTPSPQTTSRAPITGQRIRVEGRKIVVDGEVLHLKGVAWNPVPKGGTHPNNIDFQGSVGQDAALMQRMGINAVRTYEPITDRDVLDALWEKGIWVVNSVYNYGADPVSNVVGRVNAVKDHPAILMWSIGNEWNYNGLYVGMEFWDVVGRIQEVARTIRQHDTEHPIASIFGELSMLDQADERLGDIDVWGINAYRGISLGDMFNVYASRSSKPMFLGEYGADAYNAITKAEDQRSQADATRTLTEEIVENSVRAHANGVCMGGFVFEFSDEWWKDGDGSPSRQDTGGIAPGGGPHPDSTFNEEWWGLVTIDRNPRQAADAYASIPVPPPLQQDVQLEHVRQQNQERKQPHHQLAQLIG
eukprot:TRINITY_DN79733_c0_g1_i1.p1 TRINITY_DN79733_c0_g1~~TRINITY_DN79733_c0_g1_i1.p1  ORF type:complete len:945 (-),score=167.42 TRINITY_DN79733_c0_g1_i1:350-3184(-)